MNNLNSILIEGNLTRDPVVRETSKGVRVCTFAVASNRYYKQGGETQQEVSFFDIEVWANLAETCAAYLEKGRGVRVVGRLKQDRWQDGDGKPQSRIKIVAEHVEFEPSFKEGKSRKGDSSEEPQNGKTPEGAAGGEGASDSDSELFKEAV